MVVFLYLAITSFFIGTFTSVFFPNDHFFAPGILGFLNGVLAGTVAFYNE